MPDKSNNPGVIPEDSVYDPSIDSTPTEENLKNVWKNLTITERRGQAVIEKSLTNLKTIIRYDKTLSGLCYNELTDQMEVHAPTPWDRNPTQLEWGELDLINLRDYIADGYTLEYSKQDIEDYALYAADLRRFNPIKKYFESLPKWDGTRRFEKIFIDYFGADDNVYTRQVAKTFLFAGIKRIYNPGCKYDYIPVLVGSQGIGKSTFFHKLGKQWFSDSLTFADMADGKKAGEKLSKFWIMEISELSGIRKQEIETVKSFITTQEDTYRAAYARSVKKRPRHCVFVGTTNDDNFLFDITGNRRFQPIYAHPENRKCDPTKISDETVDQIWAEVLHEYQQEDFLGPEGIVLYLSKDAEDIAEDMRRNSLETNEIEGIIGKYLDIPLPEKWEELSTESRWTYLHKFPNIGDYNTDFSGPRVQRDCVCILEICNEFLGLGNKISRRDSLEIQRCLKKLNWLDGDAVGKPKRKRTRHYGEQKMFYRP